MTSITIPTATLDGEQTAGRYVRGGLVATAAAATANVALAGVATIADVPLEIPQGEESIPVLAFGQLTVMSALLGLVIARLVRTRSARPGELFGRIAGALTVLSLVPPVLVDATVATKVVLVVTHLVAAAIIVPVVARRLER